MGESQCPVPTDFLYPKAIAPIGVTVPETAHVLAAYESLADMDIIHDHTFLGPLISGPARDAQAAGRAHQPRPVHRRDPAGARRDRQARRDRGDLALAGRSGRDVRRRPDRRSHPSRHRPRPVQGRSRRRRLPDVHRPDVAGQGRAPRRPGRQEGRQAAGAVDQDARGQRDRLLRGGGQPAARPGRRDAVGDPAGAQDRAAARRRRDAQPDHLARAVRPGDGRGTRVRHAGACLPERSRSGDH